MKYFDENTWEELDAKRVAAGERAALKMFKNMGVYDCETREAAANDKLGGQAEQGYAHEPRGSVPSGWAQRKDELFAGTLSLMAGSMVSWFLM